MVQRWIAMYSLGLPHEMRSRRRDEVAADLADETVDAIRHGDVTTLRRRRLTRLALGIPADLSWRFIDAPAQARRIRGQRPDKPWVPVSRWSLALLAIAAIVSAGALAIVVVPWLTGQWSGVEWPGWGVYGFVAGFASVLLGVVLSVPWPRRGVLVMVPGIAIGLMAAPWLWGCWALCFLAVAVRWYLADQGAAWPGTPGVAGGAR